MDRNVKPSEVMKPAIPSLLPVLAIQAARRKIAERKASIIDPFLDGYITASLEKGHNTSPILNKCATKGYDISKTTIDQFITSIKHGTHGSRSMSSSSSSNYSSEDSEFERKINCFEIASRGIITVLNLLFFLVSASMVIFGCIIKYGSAKLLRYLEPIFESIEEISTDKNYPLGNISIGHLIIEAATVAIVLGSVLLFIAWFGWCGACCKQRSMLVMYCALLTLILAFQVTIVILVVVMRTRVDLALKKPWKDTLIYQYKGIQGQDSLSVSWNYIMNSLDCCGVQGSEDFDKSHSWDRIYHDPHTMRSVHLSIPLVCCKYLGEYPNIKPPRNYSCAVAPDKYNSNYKTGCYNEIWNYITRAELTLACVMMVTTIIQMMLIFSSVYLIVKINKDDSKYDE